MSDDEDQPQGPAAEDRSGITFEWEVHPRGRTQVQARALDRLFHCAAFRLDDSRERARFCRQVAARAGADLAIDVTAEVIEHSLLAMIDEMSAQQAEAAPPAPAQFQAVEGQPDPARDGFYSAGPDGPVQLTNFLALFDRDIKIRDGHESRRRFVGRLTLLGATSHFAIDAEDFANPHKLAAAIFAAAGPKAQILGRPELLRAAISACSEPTARVVTTDFGWSESGDAYLAPSARVDGRGAHATVPDDAVRIDLAGERCARHLDLAVPGPGEVEVLKRHVVEDLLTLHDRRVTFALLASVALAVLFRFVGGMNRPALWMVGLTGGGKSFAAKLFQNFFGDFPVELGSAVGAWLSTGNFLQRQGYFFKDASYLIDDYKSDVTRQADVVRLLQNYADGSARGRLNSDATSNVSREIRGIPSRLSGRSSSMGGSTSPDGLRARRRGPARAEGTSSARPTGMG